MRIIKTKKQEPQDIHKLDIKATKEKTGYDFQWFQKREQLHADGDIPVFCTYIDEMAWDAFLSLADAAYHKNNRGHEACGVFLGKYFKDEHGEFIVGVQLESGTGESTSKVLCEISYEDNARMSEICQKKEFLQVVWVHSHPGYGVFYSNQDNQTLREKYYEKFHVGIVVDNRQLLYKAFRVENKEAIVEYEDTFLVKVQEQDCLCYKPFPSCTKSVNEKQEGKVVNEVNVGKKDVIREIREDKIDPKKSTLKLKKKDRLLIKLILILLTITIVLESINLAFSIYKTYLSIG